MNQITPPVATRVASDLVAATPCKGGWLCAPLRPADPSTPIETFAFSARRIPDTVPRERGITDGLLPVRNFTGRRTANPGGAEA